MATSHTLIRRAYLAATATLLACSLGCDSASSVDLDGARLCIPGRFIGETDAWNPGTFDVDAANQSVWIVLPVEELRAEVPNYENDTMKINGRRRPMDLSIVVGGVSSVSGLSQVQQWLLAETQDDDAPYQRLEGTEFLKVQHLTPGAGFSVVRTVRSQESTQGTRALLRWIVAYCTPRYGDSIYQCGAQRTHGNLYFTFHIAEPNMALVDDVERHIEARLDAWQEACRAAR